MKMPCPLSKKGPCEYARNKRYNYGFVSGSAGEMQQGGQMGIRHGLLPVGGRMTDNQTIAEAMGLCWHEWHIDYVRSFQKCKKCGIEISRYNVPPVNPDFSTWEGFGIAWEWTVKQEWWETEFAGELCTALIDPPVFAAKLAEFLRERKTCRH